MRNLVRSLVLFMMVGMALSATAFGQAIATRPAPQCRQDFDFTAAADQKTYDNRPVVAPGTFDKGGCDTWTVEYFVSGFSAASLSVKAANDLAGAPSTLSAWATAGGTMITGSFPSTATDRAAVTFKDYFPWVQVTLNSKTGTGHVTGVLYGWVTNPNQVSATITGDVMIDVSTLAKENGGNLAAIAASVAGTLTVGSHAVTNAGTFPVQATLTAETTKVIGTVNIAASQTIAVTNAGTFATQATLAAETTKVIGTVNVAASQTIAVTNAGTFAVQATLTAETTKVIGTINVASGQTIAITNTAFGATGSAVPAGAAAMGGNVSGTLRGITATNVSGSIYGLDANIVGVPGIVYNSTQPTVANGSTAADFQITARGELKVAPGVSGFTVTAANACKTDTVTKEYYISVGTSEDEHQIKATPGIFCGISARNANATTNAFVKCTNLTAASTTPGSSTIWYEMMVPFGLGFIDRNIGAPFSVALTCYIVTGKTASDATEVAADDVSYFITYQ